MQKELDEEEPNQEDDWGNPPSPDTPENRKKALRAQIILGIFGLVGVLLPGFLYWLKFKWKVLSSKKNPQTTMAIENNTPSKSGFTKIEFLLWIAILAVLIFLLIPFFNSLKSSVPNPDGMETNSSFHFESWNQGYVESNFSADKWALRNSQKDMVKNLLSFSFHYSFQYPLWPIYCFRISFRIRVL